jgi:hypothetical protein
LIGIDDHKMVGNIQLIYHIARGKTTTLSEGCLPYHYETYYTPYYTYIGVGTLEYEVYESKLREWI